MTNLIKLQCGTLLAITSIILTSQALAHSGGGPLGTAASATDLAAVSCFDDGNGKPDRLVIQVQDSSPPIPGLLVNMQAYKDNKMTNTTDSISGDALGSPVVSLKAGEGQYLISVNKTNAGVRNFVATWHCETSNGTHTGTDITVLQIQ